MAEQQEGLAGLMVGSVPRMVRRSLMAAITWAMYEEIVRAAPVTTHAGTGTGTQR